jgi:hypothetical protein
MSKKKGENEGGTKGNKNQIKKRKGNKTLNQKKRKGIKKL